MHNRKRKISILGFVQMQAHQNTIWPSTLCTQCHGSSGDHGPLWWWNTGKETEKMKSDFLLASILYYKAE